LESITSPEIRNWESEECVSERYVSLNKLGTCNTRLKKGPLIGTGKPAHVSSWNLELEEPASENVFSQNWKEPANM
jgi:hypothetical protein